MLVTGPSGSLDARQTIRQDLICSITLYKGKYSENSRSQMGV